MSGETRSAIMARSGPEDRWMYQWDMASGRYNLVPNSAIPVSSLVFKDEDWASKAYAMLDDMGRAGAYIINDLAKDRNICTKPRFLYQLCTAARPVHLTKECSPLLFEHTRCQLKSYRAVDMLCRKEFDAYAACRAGGDVKACLAAKEKFDICTEDF